MVTTINDFRVFSAPQDDIIAHPMGHLDVAITETVVSTTDVSGAENLVLISNPDHVVLGVHRMRPEVGSTIDRKELEAQMTDYMASEGYDVDDFRKWDDNLDFENWAKTAVLGLAECGFCPEVDISVLWEGEACAPMQICIERAGYRKFYNDSKPSENRSIAGQTCDGSTGFFAMVDKIIELYDLMR